MSVVDLYREPDGRWRWAYRERPGSRPLPSNEDYADPISARAEAAAAYPGVPIEEVGGPSAGERLTVGPREGGLAAKVAGWLGPVVVLIAWARSRRR